TVDSRRARPVRPSDHSGRRKPLEKRGITFTGMFGKSTRGRQSRLRQHIAIKRLEAHRLKVQRLDVFARDMARAPHALEVKTGMVGIGVAGAVPGELQKP